MKFILLFLCLIAPGALAQQPVAVRLATYNLASPTPSATSVRLVVDGIQPDILIVQGVPDESSFRESLRAVLDCETGCRFTGVPFHNGPDFDNGLLYDAENVTFVSASYLPTAHRDIAEYVVAVRATSDTLHLFSLNLTEGPHLEAEQQRLAQIRVLCERINSLPLDARYVIAGTFSFKSSQEPAYQLLILSSDQNRRTVYAQDPSNGSISTDWYNNPDYAYLMTFSTKGKGPGGPGGVLPGGGLMGRFDMMLLSVTVASYMTSESYTTFGNDGQHFNKPINVQPNIAVDSVMAQALHDASDHLPVHLDLVFTAGTSGVDEEESLPWMEMDLSAYRR
jgi:hypothetical protein